MNAHIKIRFFATFKEIVGKGEITHNIRSTTTLGEILNMLGEKYGKDFKQTINKNTKQIDINTLIMLNGQNVRDIDVKLKDNDVIIITVPLGGG